MIPFDNEFSYFSQMGWLFNQHLEKKKSSPKPRNPVEIQPTPPVRQFDNMILTPDGHLKLLDFGTGDLGEY